MEYVFGYGSLISSESRARTGVTGNVWPASAKGIRRGWISPSLTLSMTAVGVEDGLESITNGVLIEVPESELPAFDQREAAYDRKSISRESLIMNSRPQGNIWVYVNKSNVAPSLPKPIAQSYVDVILNACIEELGDVFAIDFINSTLGWEFAWVNDRENPRYSRALRETPFARRIDEMLESEVRPEFYSRMTI